MSKSKTYQQSLADVGSETRPPMLERGSYIPWARRFRRYLNQKRDNRKWLLKALDEGPYVFKNFIPKGSTIPRLQTAEDLEGDDLLLHDAKMEVMNMILLSIPNEIYNFVDACTSAKDMWKRVDSIADAYVHEEVVEGVNAPKWRRKGHYARKCPKLRVRDSKYFMEQMLLAKQDGASVILTDEQNNFRFVDASRIEEIEELSANICLMARNSTN
ncbi:hypothetical protein Tco_0615070 [Tanacetum coccineum]